MLRLIYPFTRAKWDMTLIIELPDEEKHALTTKAREAGLPVEHYARQLIERDLGIGGQFNTETGDKWQQKFDVWADSFPDTPLLSEEAITRANMYPDRW